MELTGDQFYRLQQALVSAFPSRAALRQMMRFRFDLALETVADGANDSEVVFNLITWAESQGRLDELLTNASAENPGNPRLKAFIAEIQAPAPAPSPPAPPAVDLAQWVPIYDTGADSTVAALAVGTAMEGAFAVRKQPVALSCRYLYEKSKRHDEITGDGTFLETAVYVAEHFGVPQAAVWPYKPGEHDLPAGQTWATLDAQPHYYARFYRLSGYDDIPAQLAMNRPVVVGLPVYEPRLTAATAATGEIPLPPEGAPSIGGHAVVVVAFQPQDGSIRFANTWGTGWGAAGFGHMSEAVARAHLTAPIAGDQLWAVAATGLPSGSRR